MLHSLFHGFEKETMGVTIRWKIFVFFGEANNRELRTTGAPQLRGVGVMKAII